MKILSFISIIVLIALTNMAHAHATKMRVKVIDVTLKGEEYKIQLEPKNKEPQNNKKLSKRITIHLKFNPKKAAFAASQSKKDFDAALKVLKNAETNMKPIWIGLMSGTGFNPIKGRPDHYRSEMIQPVSWFKGLSVVCFFHSDRYLVAPK